MPDQRPIDRLCFLLLLCLLLTGCGQAEQDWQAAVSEDTVEAYVGFMEKHPKHKRVADARLAVEELEYSQATKGGSVADLDAFLQHHPSGPVAEKARKARLAEIHFQEASSQNTVVAYRRFLVGFGDTHLAQAAEEGIQALRERRHESLRQAKTFGVVVDQRYDAAEGVQLPLAKTATRIASFADLTPAHDTDADMTVEITCRGHASGAHYLGGAGFRYTGASITGAITLKSGNRQLTRASFSGTVPPPQITFGLEGKTPAQAPFNAAIFEKRSFLEELLVLLGNTLGYHVIIPFVSEAQRLYGWDETDGVVWAASTQPVMAAILRVRGRSAFDVFSGLMGSEDRYVRQAAITGLVMIGDSRCVDLCERTLQNDTGGVRARAAKALEQMGWRPRTPAIKVRYLLVKQDSRAVERMGAVALPPLRQIAEEDKDVMHRTFAIGLLSRLNDRQSVPVLVRGLADGDALVRRAVCRGLRDLGDPSAIEPLIGRLRDPDGDVRADAGEALQKITGQDLGQDYERWLSWMRTRAAN